MKTTTLSQWIRTLGVLILVSTLSVACGKKNSVLNDGVSSNTAFYPVTSANPLGLNSSSAIDAALIQALNSYTCQQTSLTTTQRVVGEFYSVGSTSSASGGLGQWTAGSVSSYSTGNTFIGRNANNDIVVVREIISGLNRIGYAARLYLCPYAYNGVYVVFPGRSIASMYAQNLVLNTSSTTSLGEVTQSRMYITLGAYGSYAETPLVTYNGQAMPTTFYPLN